MTGYASVQPGTRLNDTLEVDRFIAAGGMGEVYAGHNIETGDPLAIKVVLPEFAADQLILDLLRKEARILFNLNHDAIVRYYGFATDRNIGRSYLAMEFVDGPSLSQRLRAQALSLEETVVLKNRLADGLQLAHEAGIVHRDISPDNVILPGNAINRAKIIDFSISKSATVDGGRTLIGSSFAGRYNYASPEQVGMYPAAEVSARSDIYSLGLVLAAGLRGEPIDMGGTIAEVMSKRTRVPGLSDIAPEMRDLLTAMLQPDPAIRVRSMAEVRDWPVAPGGRGGAAPFRASGSAARDRPSGVNRIPPNSRPAATKRPAPRGQSAARPVAAQQASPRRAGLWIGLALVGTILLGAGGGWYYVKSATEGWNKTAGPTDAGVGTTTSDGGAKSDIGTADGGAPAGGDTGVATGPPKNTSASTQTGGDTGTGGTGTVETGKTEPAPPGIATVAAMMSFAKTYDAGSCVSLTPKQIDGGIFVSALASDKSPIEKFVRDFNDKFRVDLSATKSLNLQIAGLGQCPAVTMLAQLGRSKVPKPGLNDVPSKVTAGGTIGGTISIPPDKSFRLLVVDGDGTVADRTDAYDPNTGNFKIGAQKPGLHIVVVILAEPEQLKSLSAAGGKPASEVFRSFLTVAKASGQVSVAAKAVEVQP